MHCLNSLLKALNHAFMHMDLAIMMIRFSVSLCSIFQETKQHIPPKQDETLGNILYNKTTNCRVVPKNLHNFSQNIQNFQFTLHHDSRCDVSTWETYLCSYVKANTHEHVNYQIKRPVVNQYPTEPKSCRTSHKFESIVSIPVHYPVVCNNGWHS